MDYLDMMFSKNYSDFSKCLRIIGVNINEDDNSLALKINKFSKIIFSYFFNLKKKLKKMKNNINLYSS